MKKILTLIIIITLLCTGCVSSLDVTTEQNDLITEYVAGVMLKYSYENELEYMKLKKLQSEAITNSVAETKSAVVNNTESKTSSVSSTSGGSNTPTKSTTSTAAISSDPIELLQEVLKLNGAKLAYSRYVVDNTYPVGDLAFGFPAGKGEKIVAIEFTITNSTATDIVLNTPSNSFVMKLSVNGGSGVTETFTILKNDILNLKNVNIKAGATFTTVAIFAIPESVAKNIADLSLSIAMNGGNALVKKLE